jgi:hypothetical protein
LIRLFNMYFLVLVVFQALIVLYIDGRSFTAGGKKEIGRKAVIVGRTMIILAVVLFISSKLA